MFRRISIHYPAYYQTAENCFSGFSTFSVTGGEKWEKTQKQHFVRFAQNFVSPALLTLESAEGVPMTPYWYRSRTGSGIRKVDCACFRHIFISGF